MKFFLIAIVVISLLSLSGLHAQSMDSEPQKYWHVTPAQSIVWDVSQEKRLPHADNIEMAGQKVAAIIEYSIDKNKRLTLSRDIIFPQLRVYNNTTESEWRKYRAYLRHTYFDDILPSILHNEKLLIPGPVDSVEIEGKLTFYHHPVHGIRIQRTLLPSMTDRFFIETWELQNTGDQPQHLSFGNTMIEHRQKGIKGDYHLKAFSDAPDELILNPGDHFSFAIYFAASLNDEPLHSLNYQTAIRQRDDFLAAMRAQLILKTPDDVLNTLFYFSKIHAAENIFDSKMGLVHSPGGGNYYAGIWANDQIEYSGPFFPYLGYPDGNTAAYNAYTWFMDHRPDDDSPIISSFEMEGDLTCCGLDRGDAAMISYGSSQFVMLRGDRIIAKELWPLIEWSLAYCHRKKNIRGVISSDTDEMEGRIPTGDANLATSSLYYGGLRNAVSVAREFGWIDEAEMYARRANDLALAIEQFFGTTIEGDETYRYFDGNTHLRHWICLPLVMGIHHRKEGTTNALLNKLWTENGVLVELNPAADEPPVFWDRGTLYALIGTFKAGATTLSLEKLHAFSEKRLLAEHVPYVIEAYPENNMRHLSAESALYCRIFLEGMLGLEPTGFTSFNLSPSLPETWDHFSIENIRTFNTRLGVNLQRAENGIQVTITEGDSIIYQQRVAQGEKIVIKLVR